MSTTPIHPAGGTTQTPLTERNLLTPYPDGRMGRPSPEEIEAGDTFVSSALCAEMELRLSVAELALAASQSREEAHELREAELVKALEVLREAADGALDEAGIYEAACIIVSQRDNARNEAAEYRAVIAALTAPPTNSKEMNK